MSSLKPTLFMQLLEKLLPAGEMNLLRLQASGFRLQATGYRLLA